MSEGLKILKSYSNRGHQNVSTANRGGETSYARFLEAAVNIGIVIKIGNVCRLFPYTCTQLWEFTEDAVKIAKDEILAEIARYVDEGEYQDTQDIADLLTAIRAYILACDAEAPLL